MDGTKLLFELHALRHDKERTKWFIEPSKLLAKPVLSRARLEAFVSSFSVGILPQHNKLHISIVSHTDCLLRQRGREKRREERTRNSESDKRETVYVRCMYHVTRSLFLRTSNSTIIMEVVEWLNVRKHAG